MNDILPFHHTVIGKHGTFSFHGYAKRTRFHGRLRFYLRDDGGKRLLVGRRLGSLVQLFEWLDVNFS